MQNTRSTIAASPMLLQLSDPRTGAISDPRTGVISDTRTGGKPAALLGILLGLVRIFLAVLIDQPRLQSAPKNALIDGVRLGASAEYRLLKACPRFVNLRHNLIDPRRLEQRLLS